ncbi:MAG: alkaline phosphatase family protein [Candidatus Nanohaloarchaea archaeon]
MDELIVLGLDGLDRSFIQEKSEELNYFSFLTKKTTSLESTLPPITIPAWASGFTGQKPESLNRFDFQVIEFEEYSFSFHPPKTRYQEFWSYIDGKAVVSDIPGFPIRDIEGYAVGGIFNVGEKQTCPHDLYDEIVADIGDFEIEGLENYNSEKKRREGVRILRKKEETAELVPGQQGCGRVLPGFPSSGYDDAPLLLGQGPAEGLQAVRRDARGADGT